MKTLKLFLNIGKEDAQRLGLTKVKEGETVSVKDEVAQEMLVKGWAVEPGQKAPQLAATAEEAEEELPPFDEMTKEELKYYADSHNIEGVTMAQARDDMLKTVKKGAKAR